jgi:hypothetical protein
LKENKRLVYYIFKTIIGSVNISSLLKAVNLLHINDYTAFEITSPIVFLYTGFVSEKRTLFKLSVIFYQTVISTALISTTAIFYPAV